ncbi:protein of unknown function [Modestobacter italicus]|uniref:Uncharacterized protein n=1 Tax=Modestobacter italicus (strain DSM 44449 / CECT 9708 / BC 501) TaxID=2732864 RepID=I4F0F2_MODI5|nr:hypothetical protein [Modestobacter marinus]CCH89115.1 protein of unknown function [Modestobacter marinus]
MSSGEQRIARDEACLVGSAAQPQQVSRSTEHQSSGRAASRQCACAALVAAHGGETHELLTDVADLLQASVAYVDRLTVEAHLERPLSTTEWTAVAACFTAMSFDEHVGDAGSLRTDWIDGILLLAGIEGASDDGRSLGSSAGAGRRWA